MCPGSTGIAISRNISHQFALSQGLSLALVGPRLVSHSLSENQFV